MSRAREFADLAGSADAGGLTGRNLVINGAMNVAQRGTSSTGTGFQTVDRFQNGTSGVDESPTQAQVDVASGTTPYSLGFRKAYRITNGNQTSGAGTSDIINYRYIFEAQDIANSGWDYTSSSSYVTLSFWAKSSVAQTFYGHMKTFDGTVYNYPFSLGALSADTWTKVTKTIPGNSGLQINNDNGQGLEFRIALFYGTDRTASVTENAWAAYDNTQRTPDNTSTWYTTNDATFEITGVQLEVGEQATPFEHRPFHDEVMRCQRYYAQSGGPAEPFASGNYSYQGDMASHGSSNGWHGAVFLPTTMRDNPTMTAGTTQAYNGSSWASWNTVSLGTRRPNSFHYDLAGTVSTSNGQSLLFRSDWKADSEL